MVVRTTLSNHECVCVLVSMHVSSHNGSMHGQEKMVSSFFIGSLNDYQYFFIRLSHKTPTIVNISEPDAHANNNNAILRLIPSSRLFFSLSAERCRTFFTLSTRTPTSIALYLFKGLCIVSPTHERIYTWTWHKTEHELKIQASIEMILCPWLGQMSHRVLHRISGRQLKESSEFTLGHWKLYMATKRMNSHRLVWSHSVFDECGQSFTFIFYPVS